MERVGPYTVIGEIGRGGAGVVLRCRAPDGRDVAVKLLLDPAKNAGAARFARERRILAELADSGGFVPLLDAGETPRGPYFVMPFVGGGTLRARLDRGALPLDEALDVVAAIAEAVARAHARGIVHRDLKPENVLFTKAGEPLVADLGLAKHFAGAPGASQGTSVSRSGEFRGTVGYMAPEQINNAKEVGPQADVFALGAILYECLTGRRAFEGDSATDVLVRVVDGHHVRARKRAPHVPVSVSAVVDRALSSDPDDRPADAGELAAALERARLAPAGGGRAGLAVGLVVAAIAALALLFTQRGSSPEPTRPATPPAPTTRPLPPPPAPRVPPDVPAPAVPTPAAVAAATSLVETGRLGSRAFRHARTPTAISMGGSAGEEIAVTGDAEGFVHWWRLADGVELHLFRVLSDEAVQAVHLIPGPEHGALLVGVRNTIRYVVPGSAQRADLDAHKARIVASARAWQKPLAATLDATGRLIVWDLGSKVGILDADCGVGSPLAIAFAPDDATIALGLKNGGVMPVQINPRKFLPAVAKVKQPIRALAYSPDGRSLAISLREGEGVVVNLDTQERVSLGGVGNAAVLAFSSERLLFGALADGGVFACDVKKTSAQLVHDGSRVTPGLAVSSSASKALYLTHPAGQPRALGAPVDEGHEGPVSALLALRDGRLASAGADGTVRIWDLASAREVACAREHHDEIVSLAASSEGALVFASRDGSVIALDGTTARVRSKQSVPGAIVACVRVLADGSTWAGTDAGVVPVGGRPGPKGPSEPGQVLEVVGDRLLSWSRQGTLALFETRSWEARWRRAIPAPTAQHALAIVSPTRAVVAHESAVRLVDLATGEDVWPAPVALEGQAGPIAASADGRLVALCQGSAVVLLSASNGAVLSRARVAGNGDAATCVAFVGDELFVGLARGPIVRLALARP